EPQKRSATGCRPQAAAGIQGEIEDRVGKTRYRCPDLAALDGEAEQVAARRAAAGQYASIRKDDDGHWSNVRMALHEAYCERLGAEGPQHIVKVCHAVARHRRRDRLLCLDEQRIARRSRTWGHGWAKVDRRRFAYGRQPAQVRSHAIAWSEDPGRRGFCVA